jgi:hypothetical protein
MSWLGANEIIGPSKRLIEADTSDQVGEHTTNILSSETHVDNPDSGRKYALKSSANNETAEAALNRLSKAYATAMECVGAMNKASNTINSTTNADQRQDIAFLDTCNIVTQNDQKYVDVLNLCMRLARVARDLFENSILRDPLISAEFASTTSYTLSKVEDEVYDIYLRRQSTNYQLSGVSFLKRKRKRQSATVLNSIGNKSTKQRIAYYSLVNYGDLLVACIPPTSHNLTILDRGVVKSLKIFGSSVSMNSVWKREIQVVENGDKVANLGQIDGKFMEDPCEAMKDSDETTLTMFHSIAKEKGSDNNDIFSQLSTNTSASDQRTISRDSETYCCDENIRNTLRLALVAYVDATAIDGMDPTVWLKLAYAAQRLGKILFHEKENSHNSLSTDDASNGFLKFRRLERHALEMSISCTGPTEVPNRTAIRALQEMSVNDASYCNQYTTISAPSNETRERKVVVDIAKYTWLSFTRFIFNICKTGIGVSEYEISSTSPNVDQPHSEDTIISPLISLRLPPLMGIPSSALQLLCSFLGDDEIWNLKNTCITIRHNVKCAKANLEQNPTMTYDEKNQATERVRLNSQMINRNNAQTAIGVVDLLSTDKDTKCDGSSPIKRQASRVSSRVRSQMAASEKRIDRRTKQQSIRYCLVAAVFGISCDDERYHDNVEDAMKRDSASFLKFSNRGNDTKCRDFDQISELAGSNGLTLPRFFNEWKQNEVAIPINLLFVILSHISIHVSGVFSASASEVEALSICILECKYIVVNWVDKSCCPNLFFKTIVFINL